MPSLSYKLLGAPSHVTSGDKAPDESGTAEQVTLEATLLLLPVCFLPAPVSHLLSPPGPSEVTLWFPPPQLPPYCAYPASVQQSHLFHLPLIAEVGGHQVCKHTHGHSQSRALHVSTSSIITHVLPWFEALCRRPLL